MQIGAPGPTCALTEEASGRHRHVRHVDAARGWKAIGGRSGPRTNGGCVIARGRGRVSTSAGSRRTSSYDDLVSGSPRGAVLLGLGGSTRDALPASFPWPTSSY